MSINCNVSSPRQQSRLGRYAIAWVAASFAVSSACSSDSAGSGGARGRTAGSGAAASGASGSGATTSGAGGSSQTAGASNGASGAGGAASGRGAGTGGGAADRQMCSAPGSTRSCCNGGTQHCEGVEFPAWGPCLDANGTMVNCSNPCATDEFGKTCDAGTPPPPPDAGKPPPPPPPDAGKPPPPGCGPGMECKPGSIRYCDDPAGEWTKATCTSSGMWGPCEVTTIPDGALGLGDCSPTDYSPEMCCPQLNLCCQNDPNGPFVDFGSGACAAVSCP